jgi:uncharacterized membrane protein YqiK
VDKTQRIITLLLIIAILFSVFSIVISYNAAKIEIPNGSVSGKVIDESGGGVKFYVEGERDGRAG